MSRRKMWNGRKRALLGVLAVVLATSVWASLTSRATASEDTDLDAPMPPPEEVFIQQRSNGDGLGNAYVLVQLSAVDVVIKRMEGTADFITLGSSKDLVILRDDGQGGDIKPGDGLYTGIATVDPTDLQRRAAEDQEALERHPAQLIPIFKGRAAVGVERPAPFDYAGFAAGKVVRFDPAVAFLEPERADPEATDPTESTVSSLHSSGTPRAMTAPITFTNPVVLGTNPFQNKVLMITNTSVIADSTRTWNPCNNTGAANGVWTFNHLMTQMANQPATGIHPSDFVESWLNEWLTPVTINQDPIPARTAMNDILSQWPRINGRLDLGKSPLRLLAIAPRLDLRRTSGGGGGYSPSSGNFLDAGEVRFIFGFVAKKTQTFDPAVAFIGADPINSSTCYALPFTVIFEYRIPKSGCQPVKNWAQGWVALNGMLPGNGGNPSYNGALQMLTQQFVMANANPTRPNGSAIGQVRTNEVALDGPWQLREFRLRQMPFGLLESNTVEDTIRNDPGSDFNNDANGTGLLRDWIVNVVKPLLATNREAVIPLVPLLHQGQRFLAGDSLVDVPDPNYITFHWNDPALNLNDNQENWARHRVSRAGCNGCHNRETFTHFTHVNPSNQAILSTWDDALGDWTYPAGVVNLKLANSSLPAELSPFLTGINQLGDPGDAAANLFDVRSPNTGDPKRNFDDLARRELDITAVAGLNCSGMQQVNAAHVQNHFRATGRLPANLFEGVTPRTLSQQLSVAIDDIRRNPIFEVH